MKKNNKIIKNFEHIFKWITRGQKRITKDQLTKRKLE